MAWSRKSNAAPAAATSTPVPAADPGAVAPPAAFAQPAPQPAAALPPIQQPTLPPQPAPAPVQIVHATPVQQAPQTAVAAPIAFNLAALPSFLGPLAALYAATGPSIADAIHEAAGSSREPNIFPVMEQMSSVNADSGRFVHDAGGNKDEAGNDTGGDLPPEDPSDNRKRHTHHGVILAVRLAGLVYPDPFKEGVKQAPRHRFQIPWSEKDAGDLAMAASRCQFTKKEQRESLYKGVGWTGARVEFLTYVPRAEMMVFASIDNQISAKMTIDSYLAAIEAFKKKAGIQGGGIVPMPAALKACSQPRPKGRAGTDSWIDVQISDGAEGQAAYQGFAAFTQGLAQVPDEAERFRVAQEQWLKFDLSDGCRQMLENIADVADR